MHWLINTLHVILAGVRITPMLQEHRIGLLFVCLIFKKRVFFLKKKILFKDIPRGEKLQI